MVRHRPNHFLLLFALTFQDVHATAVRLLARVEERKTFGKWKIRIAPDKRIRNWITHAISVEILFAFLCSEVTIHKRNDKRMAQEQREQPKVSNPKILCSNQRTLSPSKVEKGNGRDQDRRAFRFHSNFLLNLYCVHCARRQKESQHKQSQ